jgi:hypothetical protein
MGQVCRRLLVCVSVCFAALAVSGTAGAAQSCGTRVLDDWRDGRIDGTYSVRCYRQALAHLPEDVRVYSTAQADITRALQAQLGTAAAAPAAHKSNGGGGGGVSPLLVVAITAAILVAAGSVAAAIR